MCSSMCREFGLTGDCRSQASHVVASSTSGVIRYSGMKAVDYRIGCVMALGGAISLTDRRMRVGAPARARAKPVPPGMAPAE